MDESRRIAELEARIAALEAQRMQAVRAPRRRWPRLLLIACVVAVGGTAAAQVIPTFTALKYFDSGQPALASDVNGNFNLLARWLEQKVGTPGQDNVVTQGNLTVPANRPSSISNVAIGGLGHDNANWAGIGHASANQGTQSPNYAVLQSANGAATFINAAAAGAVSLRLGNSVTALTATADGVAIGGRFLPNYDSGWVLANNSGGSVDATFTHNFNAYPSIVNVLACGAISGGNCTTRVVHMMGRGPIRNDGGCTGPVNVTSSTTDIKLGFDTCLIWGYWQSGTWTYTGDHDGNTNTAYYRVMAWR